MAQRPRGSLLFAVDYVQRAMRELNAYQERRCQSYCQP